MEVLSASRKLELAPPFKREDADRKHPPRARDRGEESCGAQLEAGSATTTAEPMISSDPGRVRCDTHERVPRSMSRPDDPFRALAGVAAGGEFRIGRAAKPEPVGHES
jgi:hypothetical protein